jgi:hypothetical protein
LAVYQNHNRNQPAFALRAQFKQTDSTWSFARLGPRDLPGHTLPGSYNHGDKNDEPATAAV